MLNLTMSSQLTFCSVYILLLNEMYIQYCKVGTWVKVPEVYLDSAYVRIWTVATAAARGNMLFTSECVMEVRGSAKLQ